MRKAISLKKSKSTYSFIGPTMWILSIQYFMVQVIVARAWPTTYSFLHNSISDLGNTACGNYANRAVNNSYVCSPKHDLMNASFIVLGIFMTLGSLLIYRQIKTDRRILIGFICLALGGIGTIIVGLFPENSVAILHVIGASLPFFVGNVGIAIIGFSPTLPSVIRKYSLVTGLFSLIFLAFYIFKIYLGIGIGGVERLTAYPQTIWLIIFGFYIYRNQMSRSEIKPK